MLKPKDNMKTLEKLFPEMYGLVKGYWYEHIASGSVALYTGSSDLTFGINPLRNWGKEPVQNWRLQFNGTWYTKYTRLEEHWVNVNMDHVIDMFKQVLEAKKGIKIGSSVYYNNHTYVVTDDWYFDQDRLMVVCNNDVGSNTHLMLLNSGGINERVVAL